MDFKEKCVEVSCGNSHTAVITVDKKLFMFGRGKEVNINCVINRDN